MFDPVQGEIEAERELESESGSREVSIDVRLATFHFTHGEHFACVGKAKKGKW